MSRLIVRIALPLALAAAACGGAAPPAGPAPDGESLVIKGDALCEQLFKANATYLSGPAPTVDGLLQVGARMMPAFRSLAPPEGDDRWTPALAARWRAVTTATGIGEELVSALWEFIGAARVTGLWICGPQQNEALAAIARPSPSVAPIPRADYARRVQKVIDATAAAHQKYHEDPDPKEVQRRIQPGVADSHGPGYLAIEDRIINGVAAVPLPEGQADEAAIFLSFLREARAAEAKGIQIGGVAGDAIYEMGFFWTSQAIGVACVVWSLDLCG